MKRKKVDVLQWHVWIVVFVLTGMAVYTAEGARRRQREGARETRREGGLYPLLRPHRAHRLGDGPGTISRPHVYNMRRLLSANGTTAAPASDKSIWEEISEFYSDSNNMAMYCVLPILVLVYGGCSAIYCVHKCRRYIRRRRHKRRHTDREGLVEEDERNDLNQEGGDCLTGSERQPIKTVSANSWDDNTAAFADVSGYNVQRKKTPLPWDTPQEMQRDDSFAEKETRRSRETNYSAGSRESSANVLQQEREKLENKTEHSPPPPPQLRDRPSGAQTATKEEEEDDRRPPPRNITTTTTTYMAPNPPPPPRPPTTITQINEASRQPPTNPRPIEIVPISRKEYQQRMEANAWDPLHQRPFESRAGAESERRGGRESAWSIRDEIMAKYDALTSLAMAKKTADVLRVNSENPNLDNSGGGGHYPDTLRRKAGGGKKKLIFIAE